MRQRGADRRAATMGAWVKRQLQQRRSLYLGGGLLILTPNLVYCDERSAPPARDAALADSRRDVGARDRRPPDRALPDTALPDRATADRAPADRPPAKPDTGPPCVPSTPGTKCNATTECPPDLVCYQLMCIVPCPPSCMVVTCDPSKPDVCASYDATCTLFCGKHQCTH